MKTVFLVEVNNGGHREAFMQLFAKALLELGHKVVCIMPETHAIKLWIDHNCTAYSREISYYELDYPKHKINISGKWQILKSYWYVWNYYKKHIRIAAKKFDSPVDLVFYNCLDGYISNYFPHQLLDLIFPYKWSGLYFHPNHLRSHANIFDQTTGISDVDYPLLSKNCIAITIHDEGVVAGFSKRLKGKKIVLFPEIADVSPPDPENVIAREIKEKANGRTVIGMIGLEPFKGSYEFMKLAKAADPDKYLFAFCGNFGEHIYRYFGNDAQAAEFRAFKEDLPDNCYWNTGFLTEGPEYNAVFNAFDVIFLVYRKFYSSSNRLTKAANFHKLVLAGDKYCVGEDVLRYHLGEAVSNSDADTMLIALEKLGTRIKNKDFPVDTWKSYAQKHSEAILKEKFEEILALL